MDNFTKWGIRWNVEFSNKFPQGGGGIQKFGVKILKSLAVVCEVYPKAFAASMVSFRFAWDRRVQLGLGQLARKRPDPPHAGHVLALY